MEKVCPSIYPFSYPKVYPILRPHFGNKKAGHASADDRDEVRREGRKDPNERERERGGFGLESSIETRAVESERASPLASPPSPE